METKPLLYGLIGFFIGGLLVSIAATTFDKPTSRHPHNKYSHHGAHTHEKKKEIHKDTPTLPTF